MEKRRDRAVLRSIKRFRPVRSVARPGAPCQSRALCIFYLFEGEYVRNCNCIARWESEGASKIRLLKFIIFRSLRESEERIVEIQQSNFPEIPLRGCKRRKKEEVGKVFTGSRGKKSGRRARVQSQVLQFKEFGKKKSEKKSQRKDIATGPAYLQGASLQFGAERCCN